MKRTAAVVLATLVLVLGYTLPGEAHYRGGVWVGVGPVWGPGWYGAPYYGYPYPYYPPAPPVVIKQEPQEYIYQPAPSSAQPEQKYWYYCDQAKAYYPYVKSCPGGWKKVLPNPAPPTDATDAPDEED